MKKLLNFLGTITLIGTSATSLISCNKTNNISCEKENHGNGKQLCSNNKPFDIKDDKGYIVIGRGDIISDGVIEKILNGKIKPHDEGSAVVDNVGTYSLIITDLYVGRDLTIIRRKISGVWTPKIKGRQDNDGTNFKAVYRGNGEGEPDTPIIDPKTGEIIDGLNFNDVKEDKKR